MQIHSVKLSREGRVLIPADVRQALGLHEGDALGLRLHEGEIRLFDRNSALKRAQNIAQKYKKTGESVVKDLLQERRAAAERE
jgi:AbrB family looped-hinge helix DNA binding protein